MRVSLARRNFLESDCQIKSIAANPGQRAGLLILLMAAQVEALKVNV
jgi:hypothetical protein